MKPEQILRLFPEVVRRTAYEGSVLSDLVLVMSEMHAPVEEVLADFGMFIDPYRCPSKFVPMIARWVGLGWLLADGHDQGSSIDERGLRDLVVHAADLAKDRGTRPGLERMLELATNTKGIRVTNSAEPFAIEVRCPESTRHMTGAVTRIVQHEKPAFVTAAIFFNDELLPIEVDDSASAETAVTTF